MSAIDSEFRACVDRLKRLQRPLDDVLAQAQQVRRSFEMALATFAAGNQPLMLGPQALPADRDAENSRRLA